MKADGVGGALESQDEKPSKDGEERISRRRLTKSPTRLARKRGKKKTWGERRVFHFHLSLSVYDMSRKGEHIKCMTHESLCASVPHQRPAERVASTAAGGMEGGKKKAISCFTWCGYPISYTKHVTKQMMPICFCSWWMFYPPRRAFTNM